MNAQLPAPASAGEFRFIPLGEIVESKSNQRRTFDDAYIGELAASIRQQGLVQPITVRRSQAHGRADVYEIVAGACRFRAAKQAELAKIPALVRHLSDEQALEIQSIENIQRKDIHPLDEAHGFKQLLAHGRSVKEVAEKVGKSEEYVRARLKLLDAAAPVQKALAEGKIHTEQATILARLPAKDQQTGLAKCTDSYRPATVQDLRHWAKERDDTHKTQSRVQGEIAKARAAGTKVVEIASNSWGEPPAKALKPGQYLLAGKTKCDSLALGFVLDAVWDGAKRAWLYTGTSHKVCASPASCPVHKKTVEAAGGRREKPRKKTPAQLLAHRKERAKAIAEKRAIAQVVARTRSLTFGDLKTLAGAFAGAIWHQKAKELIERRGWTARGFDIRQEIARQAQAMDPQALAGLLVELTITEDPDTLKAFAKGARVDLAKLEHQALAELTKKPAAQPAPKKK